jgi:uncharacterized repeat protein (TIGR01451 family)
MSRSFHGVALVALLLPLLGAAPAAAQTAADSSAFGESVDLRVLPLLGSGLRVASGPFPQVSGSAPPAYSKSARALSAAVSTPLTGRILKTSILDVDASSAMPAATRTGADAVVAQVALSLGHLLPLLALDAAAISSAAVIDGTCGSSLTASGSSDLANARIGGSLGLGLSVASHPAPNTVLLNVAGIKVILNEQIRSGDGTMASALTVNAVHVSLQNSLVSGIGVLSGDIVIAQSRAAVQCPGATEGEADLTLAGSVSPEPVLQGGTLTYTLTVTNQGPDAATATVLTNTLPDGVTAVSATASQGSCSLGTTTTTCDLGTLAPGESVQVDILTTAVTAEGGKLVDTASVESAVPDPNPADNMVIVTVFIQGGA